MRFSAPAGSGWPRSECGRSTRSTTLGSRAPTFAVGRCRSAVTPFVWGVRGRRPAGAGRCAREAISMTEPHTLTAGLVIGESARWHDGRLWFAHWGTQEIVAVDLDGETEVVGPGQPGLGWSIDWLPDGRLLMTGQGLTRREPDGSSTTHADLSGMA